MMPRLKKIFSARFNIMATLAGLAIGLPLISQNFAQGAAGDTAPDTSPKAITSAPPNGMPGWTIPDPVNPPTDPTQAAMIARGKYLTVAGDCLPCHSVRGETPFAGGLAVGSPVGAVISPNITPDKKYGIGNYTDKQFWNVLHNGIAPGSSLLVFPKYLYPSMPYDAYSKLSYSDVMAIKAYLMSLPASPTPNKPTQIPFPLNTRAALLGWRMLFFHPQPVQYDGGWTPQVRNGAYLVQALGHCSDCHTPRNILFGSEYSKFLSGGHILAQSWYAPNITSSPQGTGNWQADDLANYLHDGGKLGAGSPFGPMQEVVYDSLSRLPASDVQDIAAYLQTATKPLPSAAITPAATAELNAGAAIYADNCARCHGANGEGVANNFPNLAGNQAISSGPSYDIISMVLGGYTPWHKDQSAMPAFRATLSDAQIAAVTNYVRTAWNNTGTADATGDQVASLRANAANLVELSRGNVEARIDNAGNIMTFDDISGTFSRDGDGLNCQLDAHLKADDPTQSIAAINLAGACGHRGSTMDGKMTINGTTSPIHYRLAEQTTGNALNAVIIYGQIPGRSDQFRVRIAMVTPND
jgi:mono/diheme cytochrome c family protein